MVYTGNTAVFMEKFQALLEQGETLPLPVQGNSMAPFLVHKRDQVWITKPDKPLGIGDIVLYQRASGAYILHRICAVNEDGYTLIGDAHKIRETGVRREQVFGIVVRAQRKGSLQEPGCFWWEFFARVWPRVIPIRSGLLRLYSNVKKLLRRTI